MSMAVLNTLIVADWGPMLWSVEEHETDRTKNTTHAQCLHKAQVLRVSYALKSSPTSPPHICIDIIIMKMRPTAATVTAASSSTCCCHHSVMLNQFQSVFGPFFVCSSVSSIDAVRCEQRTKKCISYFRRIRRSIRAFIQFMRTDVHSRHRRTSNDGSGGGRQDGKQT